MQQCAEIIVTTLFDKRHQETALRLGLPARNSVLACVRFSLNSAERAIPVLFVDSASDDCHRHETGWLPFNGRDYPGSDEVDTRHVHDDSPLCVDPHCVGWLHFAALLSLSTPRAAFSQNWTSWPLGAPACSHKTRARGRISASLSEVSSSDSRLSPLSPAWMLTTS